MGIEIGVMQSEDMCMDINTMGRPPADVPPHLADEYVWWYATLGICWL